MAPTPDISLPLNGLAADRRRRRLPAETGELFPKTQAGVFKGGVGRRGAAPANLWWGGQG